MEADAQGIVTIVPNSTYSDNVLNWMLSNLDKVDQQMALYQPDPDANDNPTGDVYGRIFNILGRLLPIGQSIQQRLAIRQRWIPFDVNINSFYPEVPRNDLIAHGLYPSEAYNTYEALQQKDRMRSKKTC